MRGLLQLVVPFLGDLAAVTLASEAGLPWRSQFAYLLLDDGGLHQGALTAAEGPQDELRTAVERVLTGGRAETLDRPRRLSVVRGPSPGAGATDHGPRTRDEIELHTAVVLPLLARGRTLGALTLAHGPSGRHFTPAELSLAEDLAGRAAIALDNARLYRDIQQADRHKNEFLSMLAHELRNPLAPIRNAVQILRLKCAHDPELTQIRDLIDRQVQQLIRLVDDLLDISRITRGKIRLQTEPVDVATVVTRAVETNRPLIDTRRHELTVTLPVESLRVEGDLVRLAQVLGNLLNNAAKYTEDGGHIWLTAERDGTEAVLRVRDTGVGIPPDMLASIFELFTQVDRTLDRSQGGLGIGLTLVRRLVEMHGGRVQVHSEGPGQGAEFVVRLPALVGERRSVATANGIVSSLARCGPVRVLVVDDNHDAADSLALLLRLGGHEVRICHDGATAVAVAAADRPRLVLLDIGLPGMDGYAVARQLRQLPELAGTVLVALTGYGQAEDVRRSHEAGFDHHLVKPADPETLVNLFASLERAASVS